MAMEWITAMDKRPCDRNLRDVELISCRLRRVEPLCRLPTSALQQLAMCGFYEDLEKGVTLFRAGEQGRFWYAVLGGSLEVRYHAPDTDGKIYIALRSVYATNFDCGDLNVAACKEKFGKEYEKEFKKLHLAAVREIFTKYISIAHEIQAELPADDDSAKFVKETTVELENDLKIINENENDNKKVVEAIAHSMKKLKWDSTEAEKLKKVIKKPNLENVLIDDLEKLAVDIAKLYTDMYIGLRAQDLKEYPEYEQINDIMTQLQTEGRDPLKIGRYATMREVIAVKFNLSYFAEINNII